MALDKDELAGWIDGEISQAKIKTATWRKDARECYAFYSSKQWSDEDAALLEQAGRPAVVFNRVARTVNAIAGLEVQNRQEVRYLPRTLDDSAKNEVLTLAAKWVRDNCDAEDEESEAFQDTLICGMGWTDTSLEYERNPDGMILIERDDALSYFWDSKAKKRNLDDRKWCAKVIPMSPKDIKARWSWEGSATSEELLDEEEQPHDATPPFYQDKDKANTGKKLVEVLCFQWYDIEKYYRCQMPDGSEVELSISKYTTLKDSLESMGVKCVKQSRRKYKKCYKIGKDILETTDSESQTGFTYNCITGLRDRNNNTWFGIVSLMLDPQRWANKWLSQIMHILNSNSKGGLLAETGAFANARKAEKEWAQPDAITWLNEGGLNKVKQKEITQMPVGIQALLQYALESINDVPGVNTELLGLADRQQAGVLENSRKQAGVTMLAIFFDSLRRYRKEQGRVMAKMITEYISDGRLIRIVGKQGEQVVPLLKDELTFEYDVIVDDAPTSPNQKEKTFAVLMQMLPQLLQAGIPMPPTLVDYMPLPDALIQDWKKVLQPDPQAEEQKKQKAKQEAMEAMQMEAQMEATKEAAKGKVQLEIKTQEADVDMRIEQMQADNALQLQQMKDQTERWKTDYDNKVKLRLAQLSSGDNGMMDLMNPANPDDANMFYQMTNDLASQVASLASTVNSLQIEVTKPKVSQAIRGADGKIQQVITETLQ